MPNTAWPNVLFLDQSGKLAGAELALFDLVTRWQGPCAVLTLEDGPFPDRLRAAGISVDVLDSSVAAIRRESGPLSALQSGSNLAAAAHHIAQRSRDFDLVYANTQKAAVLAAASATVSNKPLVIHLHDIVSDDHFSRFNQRVARRVLSRADAVIADSEATRDAYVNGGGEASQTSVVHYGFETPKPRLAAEVRSELGVAGSAPMVGLFSRISPWKGQDVFIEALAHLPSVVGLIVGTPLFGEELLAESLRQRAEDLGISERVRFLGFREDVADLMAACDLTVHTSTSPEPFGRVIVESMLAGTPVVAADAGGPRSIITDGYDGWLIAPGKPDRLARAVSDALTDATELARVAGNAQRSAAVRFTMEAYVEGVRAICQRVVEEHHGG